MENLLKTIQITSSGLEGMQTCLTSMSMNTVLGNNYKKDINDTFLLVLVLNFCAVSPYVYFPILFKFG